MTVVTSSATPVVLGMPVTFTATVTVVAPGAGAPTGSVTFLDGATTLGWCRSPTAPGRADVDRAGRGRPLDHGRYGGDGSFAASTSLAVIATVIKASTSLALATSGQLGRESAAGGVDGHDQRARIRRSARVAADAVEHLAALSNARSKCYPGAESRCAACLDGRLLVFADGRADRPAIRAGGDVHPFSPLHGRSGGSQRAGPRVASAGAARPQPAHDRRGTRRRLASEARRSRGAAPTPVPRPRIVGDAFSTLQSTHDVSHSLSDRDSPRTVSNNTIGVLAPWQASVKSGRVP